MKNFLKYLAMSVLLLGIVSSFAVEERVMTENELRLCQTPLGIEIRQETLRRSIEWFIAKSDSVIQYLEEKGKDTEKLVTIREEVMNLLEEEIPKDNIELAIEKIIEIKTTMHNLTKLFKEELFKITTPEERSEIAQIISKIKKPPLDDLKMRIRQHNAMLIQRRLENIINETERKELIEKYINGEITKNDLLQQLRIRVKEKLRNNEEMRVKVFEQLRINQERQIRTEIMLRNMADEKTIRVRERVQEKLLNINRSINNIEKQQTRRGRP